jgi:hypothetical protein
MEESKDVEHDIAAISGPRSGRRRGFSQEMMDAGSARRLSDLQVSTDGTASRGPDMLIISSKSPGVLAPMFPIEPME